MIIQRIDTIEISRLAEVNPAIRERFIKTRFHPPVIKQARNRNESLSGLFAAKEALPKLLGTASAMSAGKILKFYTETGQPILHLHGNAKKVADKLGLKSGLSVVSHDRDKAVAVAVAIGG